MLIQLCNLRCEFDTDTGYENKIFAGIFEMRKSINNQVDFTATHITQVRFDLSNRHEINPILRSLQYLYSHPKKLKQILGLIEKDINSTNRKDMGTIGLDYWEILVLSAVRLGCDLDYDALSDLADNHRNLRAMIGLSSYSTKRFPRSTIHGNITALSSETVHEIAQLVVEEGHKIRPKAMKKLRGDSFVVETNIHHPTDASLIVDGVRKISRLAFRLAALLSLSGWRQYKHYHRKVKKINRQIQKVVRGRSKNKEEIMSAYYEMLTTAAEQIVHKALDLVEAAMPILGSLPSEDKGRAEKLLSRLTEFMMITEHIKALADRRVLKGEVINADEKTYSIFEPHTELVKRGKKPYPIEFGRRVFVLEDKERFIVDAFVMEHRQTDDKIVIPVVDRMKARFGDRIESISFDKGFHSPENQAYLEKHIPHPCLPRKGKQKGEIEMTKEFKKSRRLHPGVESAINALESGNGLDRCRDKGEEAFERYVALAELGRNLQRLGEILLEEDRKKQQKRPSG